MGLFTGAQLLGHTYWGTISGACFILHFFLHSLPPNLRCCLLVADFKSCAQDRFVHCRMNIFLGSYLFEVLRILKEFHFMFGIKMKMLNWTTLLAFISGIFCPAFFCPALRPKWAYFSKLLPGPSKKHIFEP